MNDDSQNARQPGQLAPGNLVGLLLEELDTGGVATFSVHKLRWNGGSDPTDSVQTVVEGGFLSPVDSPLPVNTRILTMRVDGVNLLAGHNHC